MGKGFTAVGGRLVQHNVYYFEIPELQKATEHYCYYYILY